MSRVRMTLRRARERVGTFTAESRRRILRGRARAYNRAYALRFRVTQLVSQFGAWIFLGVLLLPLAATIYVLPQIYGPVSTYYENGDRLSAFRSLLQSLGGALLGAAAIVSSLVLFAMQVNVERMPYGLFRQFGSDRKLLSAFAATFLLALLVAALSALPDQSWAALVIAVASWATALILILFLYAYRRALRLISPTMQVEFVVQDASKYFNTWARRATRAGPLFQVEQAPARRANEPTHDAGRVLFFQMNAHWTNAPKQGLQYLMSIARRYAEKGDHDVSRTALAALVAVNAAYVKAKGKTFFTTHFMVDNPLSTDGFVTATLEHLRQYTRAAIARRDEEQIEQALRALSALASVYLTIDYSDLHASKTHAALAAGYLGQEVEAVIPNDMPDVLMEGVRLLGQTADAFRGAEEFEQIQSIAEKIRTVASVGAVKENHRPVTSAGIQELANLTFSLLRTQAHDLRFTLEAIRNQVAFIAELFIKIVPDTPLLSAHSTYLGPYYSPTSIQSLGARLTQLVNALLSADADDENAKAVIENIEEWAEELFRTEKNLLLLAVEKRSQFTFDMICWVQRATEFLLATSQSPACDDHTRGELQKHALWLAGVLSWLPDDAETIAFLERFPLTETMFEVAVNAKHRDCMEVAEEGRKLLLDWAFKAGKYRGGWKGVEALSASATLALLDGTDHQPAWLRQAVGERLAGQHAPSQEVREQTARSLRERAGRLRQRGDFTLSRLEHAMSQVDQARLRALLLDIANAFAHDEQEEPAVE